MTLFLMNVRLQDYGTILLHLSKIAMANAHGTVVKDTIGNSDHPVIELRLFPKTIFEGSVFSPL